jgi:hypothetical protein
MGTPHIAHGARRHRDCKDGTPQPANKLKWSRREIHDPSAPSTVMPEGLLEHNFPEEIESRVSANLSRIQSAMMTDNQKTACASKENAAPDSQSERGKTHVCSLDTPNPS